MTIAYPRALRTASLTIAAVSLLHISANAGSATGFPHSVCAGTGNTPS